MSVEQVLAENVIQYGFAGFALYLVVQKMEKISKEVCSLREAFFILTDAQTEEIKKKSERAHREDLEELEVRK